MYVCVKILLLLMMIILEGFTLASQSHCLKGKGESVRAGGSGLYGITCQTSGGSEERSSFFLLVLRKSQTKSDQNSSSVIR